MVRQNISTSTGLAREWHFATSKDGNLGSLALGAACEMLSRAECVLLPLRAVNRPLAD